MHQAMGYPEGARARAAARFWPTARKARASDQEAGSGAS